MTELLLRLCLSCLASFSWNLINWKVFIEKTKNLISIKLRSFHCLSDSLFYGAKIAFKIWLWILESFFIRSEFGKGLLFNACFDFEGLMISDWWTNNFLLSRPIFLFRKRMSISGRSIREFFCSCVNASFLAQSTRSREKFWLIDEFQRIDKMNCAQSSWLTRNK